MGSLQRLSSISKLLASSSPIGPPLPTHSTRNTSKTVFSGALERLTVTGHYPKLDGAGDLP